MLFNNVLPRNDSSTSADVRGLAAAAVGLRLMASASIASTAQRGERKKGRRRPEHVLLLENPS